MTRPSRLIDSQDDYEVVGVSPGQKPGGVVLHVRLKPDEMELLAALSTVGGRTLSETLRLGLRCLGQQPPLATGTSTVPLRLETRGTAAVTDIETGRTNRSQPAATEVVWAPFSR